MRGLGSPRAAGRARDGGAALVEFAVLMPLLLLLVLGIVDFGYALVQNLDVRHGARETSRMIAVDDFDLTTACNRMDVSTNVTIALSRTGNQVGDDATAQITADLRTASGFFDSWLPSTIDSSVSVRIEQTPTWTTVPQACP